MSELYCTYCGRRQSDRLSCCGECHWMTDEEFFDYHGDWPDDSCEDDDPMPYGHHDISDNDPGPPC